jgi:hypothetical protein
VLLESNLGYAETPGEGLQLAGRALLAGGAAFAVIREKKLNDDFSHSPRLFRVGAYRHTVGRGRRTGRDKAFSININHAEAACSVDTQLGMVAECGKIHPGLAYQFQEILFVFNGYLPFVDGNESFVVHDLPPMIAPNLQL